MPSIFGNGIEPANYLTNLAQDTARPRFKVHDTLPPRIIPETALPSDAPSGTKHQYITNHFIFRRA